MRAMRRMREQVHSQGGAALVTVLVFMVLTFIMISGMLLTSGNEIAIAALQRDSFRALEVAQLGLNELIQRIEEAHPYMAPHFTAAQSAYCRAWTGPGACPLTSLSVTRKVSGDDSSYLQLDATATVGRSTRRLTALVLQVMRSSPPDVTFAHSFAQEGAASDVSGDVYSRTYIKYQSYPSSGTISYAGWAIRKDGPTVGPCYNYAHCQAVSTNSNLDRWYPGTRRSVYRNTVGTDQASDILNWAAAAIAAGCDATVGNTQVTGIKAESNPQTSTTFWLYGFDRDNVTYNTSGTAVAIPSQLDPDRFPCGLPYKYVSEQFKDFSGALITRYFKTVVYEDWFENYWRFDEATMVMVKRGNGAGTQACVDDVCTVAGYQPDLKAYPNLGAVPPVPQPVRMEEGNYDLKIEAGVNAFDSNGDGWYEIDASFAGTLGCKSPEMSCPSGTQPKTVWVTGPPGTKWTFNANLQGHGTMVVDGNVKIEGTLDYWGTFVINGEFDASGAGTANIYGGLVSQGGTKVAGDFTSSGGTVITSPPVGRSLVLGKAWWER